MGRQVRKGERGIVILAPVIRRRENEDSELGEKERAVVAFRHAYVFDIAQTDGEPLPQLATRLVGEDPRDAYSGKPPQSLVSI
jgi:antirestriction protein ArdC